MFADYYDDSKLSAAIVVALSNGKTRIVKSTTPTCAFPLIKSINGTAADDQNGFTKEMYVQRIFARRRLNQYGDYQNFFKTSY